MPNPTGKGGFKPGQSGNPAGRPRGAVSAAVRLRREIEANGDDILRKQIERAKQGNPYIAKFLLELILPRAKTLPLREPIALEGDLPQQAETVKRMLAEGSVSLDEAASLIEVIGGVQAITDRAALAQRVAELEAKLAALTGPAPLPALPKPTRGDDAH